MDLQAKINDKFAELIEEGYVDKIVKETLQGTVTSIVRESLRDYSTFATQLKKHLEEGMGVNLSRLSLDHYNEVVLRVVQEEVNGTVLASVTPRIKERIQGVLGRLDKQEWKLSEIVKAFKEEVSGYGEKAGEVGLYVEQSESRDGGWHIYLDEEPGNDREPGYLSSLHRKTRKPYYSYKYKLHLRSDGTAYNFSIDNQKDDYAKGADTGFDALWFQLYANKVAIEVDEDECVLAYQEEYD